MKRFTRVLLLFLVINIISLSEVKISVDNINPEVKQHVVLSVEFLGEEKTEYTINGIEKFKITSMVSRSNFTSINKKVNYSKSDIYILCPYEEGKAVLSVKTKNGSLSNQIAIEVLKESPEKNSEQKFILEMTPYKRDFYMGEKIPFAERVIIKSSVTNYNYVSTPVFNGFSVRNITPRDSRGFPIPKRITSKGQEYVEVVLYRSILEPVSIGKKIIKSGGVSFVEELADATEKPPVYLGFKELEINILSLPEKNKPYNFQGIVGKLEGNSNWEEGIVNGKKAYILRLSLSGDANLDRLEKIIEDNSFLRRKFNIKENLLSYNERVVDSVYFSEKEYEIIFFPKYESSVKIPPIIIPYFNPVEKKYENFTINGFN